MSFRRRSARRTGFVVAGAMLAVSLLFSAQMFGELHVPIGILPQPPLPHIPFVPVSEFINPEVMIPVDPAPVDLGMPGGIDHPVDRFLPSGYAIGFERAVPPISLASHPTWGFGPSVAGKEDIWIPPAAWSRFAESYNIGSPGYHDFWPYVPDHTFHGGRGNGGWPPPPQISPPPPDNPPVQPAVPEPGSLIFFGVALLLTRRPIRRTA